MAKLTCPAHADRCFGPQVDPICRSFDFTQFFEEGVFGVATSSLFLIASFGRILQLQKRHPCDPPSAVRIFCGVVFTCLAALSLTLLLLWASGQSSQTRATLPAAALTFVDILVLFGLSCMESSKFFRPPVLVASHLFLSVLLDIARARTYWLSGTSDAISAIFVAAIIIKAVALALESCPLQTLCGYHSSAVALEQAAGIFGLGLWTWLDGFLFRGYRHGVENLEDLVDTDEALLSKALCSTRLLGHGDLAVNPLP